MNEISFERWVNLSSSRKDILSLWYNNNIKIRTHDGSNVITDVIVMFVHSNLILEYIQAQPIYTFVEFYVRDDGKY